MAATRPDMLDYTAERLLRLVFESVEVDGPPVGTVPETELVTDPSSLDASLDEEPTDEELNELSAAEEDALYGKGAGQYGGADGSEDAFQSYLHDIRGLSLLSHEEEIILAKRSQSGDGRA